MVSSVRRTAPVAEPAAPQPVAADLPWLLEPLAQTLATQRSHALLLQGPSGVGQFEMALALARAWLCETPVDDDLQRPHGLACGHCGSCHLVDERSHPDLRLIVPEALRAQAGLEDDAGSDADGEGSKKRKPSREIKVEQIRAAIDFSELTAGRAALKVLLVHPAEALNAVASNALLKTLEEPPGRMRFVLSTSAPQALLPTIRSRCQAVPLRPPPVAQAIAWLHTRGVPQPEVLLAASGDQPLAAWALHQGGLDAAQWLALPERVRAGDASAFSGWALPVVVDALQKLCHDRLMVGLNQPPRYFAGARLPAGLPGGDVARLTAWGAALRRHARHAEHPWNAGLAVEALLIEAAAVDAAPIHSKP
ncbi:MAG: DNA polymerase III subunit delta' [Leptothrix sp. (in: b-proteobacteria)]